MKARIKTLTKNLDKALRLLAKDEERQVCYNLAKEKVHELFENGVEYGKVLLNQFIYLTIQLTI